MKERTHRRRVDRIAITRRRLLVHCYCHRIVRVACRRLKSHLAVTRTLSSAATNSCHAHSPRAFDTPSIRMDSRRRYTAAATRSTSARTRIVIYDVGSRVGAHHRFAAMIYRRGRVRVAAVLQMAEILRRLEYATHDDDRRGDHDQEGYENVHGQVDVDPHVVEWLQAGYVLGRTID